MNKYSDLLTQIDDLIYVDGYEASHDYMGLSRNHNSVYLNGMQNVLNSLIRIKNGDTVGLEVSIHSDSTGSYQYKYWGRDMIFCVYYKKVVGEDYEEKDD